MTETIFVDTNVLVYARDPSEGEKHRKAWRWVMDLRNSRAGRVSYEVLHEYYLTVTQKLDPGLTKRLARADVRSLMTWRPVVLLGFAGRLRGAAIPQHFASDRGFQRRSGPRRPHGRQSVRDSTGFDSVRSRRAARA